MIRPWSRAARVLVVVAAVTAVVAGLVVLRVTRPGVARPEPSATGQSPTESSIVVSPSPLPEDMDVLPWPGAESSLAALETALPPAVFLGSVASPLSGDPVRRALALFEVGHVDGATEVLVLGDDGRARRLDVVSLAPATDEQGSPRSAVSSRTLSPDGRRAAFPQRDRLLLVDLTTANVDVVPLPGFNVSVGWLGDRVVVAGSGAAAVVDVASLAVASAPYSGHLVVASATVGASVVELSGGGTKALGLRVWTGDAHRDVEVAGLPAGSEWSGLGVRSGAAVAAQYGSSSLADPTRSIAAFDAGDATLVRRLLVPLHPQSWSAVLGWLDERTVLVWRGDTDGWVLAWNIASGHVHRVAEVTGDRAVVTVSLGSVAR